MLAIDVAVAVAVAAAVVAVTVAAIVVVVVAGITAVSVYADMAVQCRFRTEALHSEAGRVWFFCF